MSRGGVDTELRAAAAGLARLVHADGWDWGQVLIYSAGGDDPEPVEFTAADVGAVGGVSAVARAVRNHSPGAARACVVVEVSGSPRQSLIQIPLGDAAAV